MDSRYEFKTIEKKWQTVWEEKQANSTKENLEKPKYYALEMFPYPSGAGLHVGHLKNYIPMDAFCRYKRMKGFNILHPMGWDAFGQPAENEAIKRGRNPREMVPEYAANYKRTLRSVGASYDWTREINSSLPDYYKWTQWFFLLLYKRGLAYRSTAPINWCPECKTGLANEEVKEGRCWRCDTQVEKRLMPQWFFRITAYADRLLTDLEQLSWSDGLKEMQRDWIGRSEGAELNFNLSNSLESIKVFTTRVDTIFGATFIVLAPEHPMLEKITVPEKKSELDNYIKSVRRLTEMERMNAERTKTGVFTGAYAINPADKKPIPIWAADYVLMNYGSGAIMAVPAHDQRDFDFAKKFGLDITFVYRKADSPGACAEPDGGTVVNSGQFNGLEDSPETREKFAKWVEDSGFGKRTVHYRLRDWLISRQRYWGAPIPIIHCPECGEVPVPEDQLPVLLPEVNNYQPSGTGESPLAEIQEFTKVSCPKCKGRARRETDTMGGYACSSWYFLRFADPHNDKTFAAREKVDHWLPVDLYSGGVEHARSHLLYSRFWCKVMYDAGLIGFTEPFQILRNQGSMLAYTPGRRPRRSETGGEGEGLVDWILLKDEEKNTIPEDQIVWRWARMSKSKGNTVSPDDIIEKYGADSLRVYEMFVVPFEEDVQWTEEGIKGSYRFINRFWRWMAAFSAGYLPDWKTAIASAKFGPEEDKIRRKLHQTIKKVGADTENFRFNTAIAAFMELTNDLYAYVQPEAPAPAPAVVSEVVETAVLLIAPFAPHMAEELWSRLGGKGLICDASWPVFDPKIAAEPEITIVVQINGKLRSRINVLPEIDEKQTEKAALTDEVIASAIKGKRILKTIVVKKRLVNIVLAQD
ncbi:MAG: leucine--tRNA ligase [Elusimicrobia bacterium RIFOXYA12_FULL_51_18]|nr:MAG: leucine--tRNA ligase [Elusimicrobia bacterium RIFOXYA12_FULL_51_18]OGS31303.1 MAG: leucine--tRNA ligase [Elusimicrobia bacterium RIFOXYA2_FULL_53_38]